MEIILLILLIIFILKVTYTEIRYVSDWKDLPINTEPIADVPLVSILIPMRNEEKSIIQTLESFKQQTYPHFEIIVIDDCSEDHSKQMVQEYIGKNKSTNIELITIMSLPEGWVGKCHALTEGVKKAKGEWFLFTDADVIHQPYSLQSVMHYVLKNDIKFISLKFYKKCIGFWEKVIVPYTYFVKGWFAPSPSKIRNLSNSSATATGDFILIRRDSYMSFNGHAHPEVKNHLVEDAAIARAAKKHGIQPVLLDGKNIIAVRKFHNLKEIFLGFGKIIAVEFQKKSIIHYLHQTSYMMLYSAIPFISIFFMKTPINLIVNICIIAVVAGTYEYYLKKEKLPFYYGLFIPLGAVMLILICTFSLMQINSKKGTVWRGRNYDGKRN